MKTQVLNGKSRIAASTNGFISVQDKVISVCKNIIDQIEEEL